jgi:hypothetical protein
MTHVHISLRSRNSKTGPIPVSTTSAKTCPPSCGLFDVCYAKASHLNMHWQRVTSGANAISWTAFTKTVRALADGQLWRHNQAGDLPGTGEAIDREALAALVEANAGKRGFTYTHKPVLPKTRQAQNNRTDIARANRAGFTINLSGNNLGHADQLAALRIGPVVTVLPRDVTSNVRTPQGRLVVVCPAVTHANVTCATCGLCQRANCNVIVGFPAHGVLVKRADSVARS